MHSSSSGWQLRPALQRISSSFGAGASGSLNEQVSPTSAFSSQSPPSLQNKSKSQSSSAVHGSPERPRATQLGTSFGLSGCAAAKQVEPATHSPSLAAPVSGSDSVHSSRSASFGVNKLVSAHGLVVTAPVQRAPGSGASVQPSSSHHSMHSAVPSASTFTRSRLTT